MEDKEYRIPDLNVTIKRWIKAKEKDLEKKCRKVWSATSPYGEQYLYGKFVSNRTDVTIVTLAYRIADAPKCWVPIVTRGFISVVWSS